MRVIRLSSQYIISRRKEEGGGLYYRAWCFTDAAAERERTHRFDILKELANKITHTKKREECVMPIPALGDETSDDWPPTKYISRTGIHTHTDHGAFRKPKLDAVYTHVIIINTTRPRWAAYCPYMTSNMCSSRKESVPTRLLCVSFTSFFMKCHIDIQYEEEKKSRKKC
jgi:hypothetical protein